LILVVLPHLPHIALKIAGKVWDSPRNTWRHGGLHD